MKYTLIFDQDEEETEPTIMQIGYFISILDASLLDR